MQPSRRLCLYALVALLVFLLSGVQARAGTLMLTGPPSGPRADAAHLTRGNPQPPATSAIPSAMTNQDVLEMTKAGLSPGVILDKISSTTSCRFDTSVSALTALKSSGVEDSVLSAMIHCPSSAVIHSRPYVWIGANTERTSSRSGIGMRGSRDLSLGGQNTETTAGTHPEYAGVARAIQEKCDGLTITNQQSNADYSVTVERYHSGHLMSQRNEFSVFRSRDGNLILSDKTTWLKNAASDICQAILKDAAANKAADAQSDFRNPANRSY